MSTSAPEQDPNQHEDFDWVETVTKLAGKIGLSEIRTRWKLERLRQQLARVGWSQRNRTRHVGYEHKTCPQCGRIADREEKVCTGCGTALGARWMQVLGRVGVLGPKGSVSTLFISLLIVIAYGRTIAAMAEPGFSMGFNAEVLARVGGHWPPAVAAGQYWRWGTAMFLHAGLWHIGFNLYALMMVGPSLEGVLGRSRVLSLFLVTGLMGNIVSYYWGLNGVGIGASGGLMGLIGVAAGWGHREGTGFGIGLRNGMLKWAIYTMVFGYFIGADNAAHAGGFVSGAAAGWFLTQPGRRPAIQQGLATVEGLVSAAVAVAIVIMIFVGSLPQ